MLDFGRRAPGAGRIRHAFALRNAGAAPLEIVDVRALYDGAETALGARRLAPGEATELQATLPLRGLRGPVEAWILVLSDDPANPELRLGFRGEIAPPVAIEPPALTLDAGDSEDRAEAAVDVTFAPDRPGRVVDARTDSPRFAVNVEEVAPDRHYRVQVRTVPPLDGAATQRAELRIVTDDGAEHRVPLAVRRLDPIIVSPAEMVLAAGERGAVTRFVSVRPGRIAAFRILGVETPEGVRASVEEAGPRGYQVRVDILRPRAELDGQHLRIVTDVEGREEIRVPFQVLYPLRRR